jgi:hypothetical protein
MLVFLSVADRVVAQASPPTIRYSTHDQVQPAIGPWRTQWVDVKTPGDGNTYVVGNAGVTDTRIASAAFSGAPVGPPQVSMQFDLSQPPAASANRQVAVVQIVGANQDIATPFPSGAPRQRYFYGISGTTTSPDYSQPTHARAISVWPTGDPNTTRIAICGETLDEQLPLSNSPAPWSYGTLRWSGFVAVFNGFGELQWTHHFYGGNDGNSAVTDLSIRRETRTIPTAPFTADFDVVSTFPN